MGEDCIEPEWEDQCRYCGATFLNQGIHGQVECPYCEQETERETNEKEN